jgi:hypothetical protein
MTSHSPSDLSPELELLAAAVSLDCLDWDERDRAATLWEGSVGEESGVFADEVESLREASGAIAHSLPPLSLNPGVKDRLFTRLGLETPVIDRLLMQLLEERTLAELEAVAATLPWSEISAMPMGEFATWQVREESRQVAFFVRTAQAGAFPRHRHSQGEIILVVSGDVELDGQHYGPGDRIYSLATTIHQPTTHQGCLLCCISALDDEYLS